MRTSESIGRDCLRLLIWYPFRWIIVALPLQWGLKLLPVLGDIHLFLTKKKQHILTENLQQIQYPNAGRPHNHGKIIRQYFRTHYLDQLLPLLLPKLTKNNLRDIVQFRGQANLDTALEKNRGVILVHGHFGPVHLPLTALSLAGYPMKQIGNPSAQGLSWIGRHVAFRLRMRYEGRIPAEIIKADGFLRPVFAALQQNNIVMTTGDGSGTEQRIGKHHLFTFLGQPVMLPLGPAILARKTGAALLPLFILPHDKPPFQIIIGKEIVSTYGGDRGIIHCTEQFIRQLEHHITICPGYMHFLDRFRKGMLIEESNRQREDPPMTSSQAL